MAEDQQENKLDDYGLGVSIARIAAIVQWSKGLKELTPRDFVRAVMNRIDFDRFDYEAGEEELFIAFLTAYRGFTQMGGEIDWETYIVRSEA